MKKYNINVNFISKKIYPEIIELVQNDYNSTHLKFKFDVEASTYLFKLKFPDNTEWVKDIKDNEITLEKGILSQHGIYQYEIASYDENKRLTANAIGKLKVRDELISTDEIVEVDDRAPVLDSLINQVDTLNIDVEKTDNIARVTLISKDGARKEVEIYDGKKGEQGIQGIQGVKGEDAKINGLNTLNILAGQNIDIQQSGSNFTINAIGGSGSSDYDDLTNKPLINDIELSGSLTSHDLGLINEDDITNIMNSVKYDYVKDGLVNNTNELSDEEKLKVENWLGLSENYLTTYNTTPYQVNDDYNPTHKKYVDEKDSALRERISEIELSKFPNATIFGAPTIQQGQVSNFSLNDYLEFPFLVDFRGRNFEINFEFTTGTDVTNQQNILDSEFGLAFAIRNRHFVLALSYNGTSWATEQIGTLNLESSRTYRVRISWSGLVYRVQYSIDGGKNYIDDIQFGGTSYPYPKQMYIGVGKLAQNYFKGSINLNYADVIIEGNKIWLGMDDAGLSLRADINLENISSVAEQKIKDIVNPNIPTKTSQLENDSNYLNAIPSDYKTKTENDILYQAKGTYLTSETDPTVPSYVKSITQQNITSWNNKSDFSGSYNDLSDKPTIPTVPTNVSAFTNDSGYLTEHQSLKTINNQSIIGTGNIDIVGGGGITSNSITRIEVVDELPSVEEEGVLYLVKEQITPEPTGNLFTCSSVLYSSSGSQYTSPKDRDGVTYTFTEGQDNFNLNGSVTNSLIQGFRVNKILEANKSYKISYEIISGTYTTTKDYILMAELKNNYDTTSLAKIYIEPTSSTNPTQVTYTPSTDLNGFYVMFVHRSSDVTFNNLQLRIIIEEV